MNHALVGAGLGVTARVVPVQVWVLVLVLVLLVLVLVLVLVLALALWLAPYLSPRPVILRPSLAEALADLSLLSQFSLLFVQI